MAGMKKPNDHAEPTKSNAKKSPELKIGVVLVRISRKVKFGLVFVRIRRELNVGVLFVKISPELPPPR